MRITSRFLPGNNRVISFLLTLAVAALPAAAQQKYNAYTQINWVPLSGSGAPALTCDSLHLGMGYVDSTNNQVYACGSTGWFRTTQSSPIVFVGAWSSTVTYSTNQAVGYGGGTYVSLQNGNLNQNPATQTAYWMLLVSGGSGYFPGSPTVTVSGAPTTGNCLIGTSSTTANWQNCPGGATIAHTVNVIKGDNAGNGVAATPGTDYVIPTGNVATSSALANTPSLCPTGQAPIGILPNGNATGCAAASGGGVLTANKLVNAPSTGPFNCLTDSIGLPWTGDFCPILGTNMGLNSANWNIYNIGSASGADLLSCDTSGPGNCTQVGTLPLTFPLGVTPDSKTLIEIFGYNDLSNMGGPPSNSDLSYFFGGLKAWMLEFAIPDSQKIAANNTTYCTTTGTWTAATSVPGGAGTFPAGTLQTSTPGATISCTGQNATDAGFILLKTTGSTTASMTLAVTNPGTSGSPFSVADPYTASTVLNQTAAYTSAWNGKSNFYAIGQAGMSGGYTTVLLTASNNSSDPVYVVGPYFISPSSGTQNYPAVAIMEETRAGCNGTCSTVGGAQHDDANTNAVRAAQIAAATEGRANGLNVNYFDPNATPSGFNSSSTAQTSRVSNFTVTASGSYTVVPTLVWSGCSVEPTGHLTLSGGGLLTGTFNTDTGGSCLGGSPSVALVGGTGSGGGVTSGSVLSDGTHPNYVGGQNIAAVALPILNSAATTADHFSPGSQAVTAITPFACSAGYVVTGYTAGAFVCTPFGSLTCGVGFAHYASVTLAAATGSSALTQYPALLGFNGATVNSITLSNLVGVGSGGQVQSPTGLDITFCTAASGGATVPFERVGYTASTGAAEFYLNISSLANTSPGATVYLFWDSTTAGDQSQPQVPWVNGGYAAVYHFGYASSLGLNDSSGFANTLTNSGAVNATGQFGAAAALTTAQLMYNSTPNGLPTGTAPRTIEAWVKYPSAPGGVSFGYGVNLSDADWGDFPTSGNVYMWDNGSSGSWGFTYTPDTNWHYYAHVLPVGATQLLSVLNYLDGAVQSSSCTAGACTPTLLTGNSCIQVNGVPGGCASPPAAANAETIDEFRISTVARSAGWVATQYANQSNVNTFATMGTIH